MRFGFVGPSYSAQSRAVADEECINFYAETCESGNPIDMGQAYGGREYIALKNYYGTPGLSVFSALPAGPIRDICEAGGRAFTVADSHFVEIASDGTQTQWATVATDGQRASVVSNGLQILIVSGGHAYCFTLATNAWLEVTSQLAGVPIQCDCSDTYGIVIFQDSRKFQISQVLDFSTWPGQLVNEVSVFAENLVSVIVNHREIWLFGSKRAQPYQDTGSAEAFDPDAGALIETGSAATFSVERLDNSVFWVGMDERGAAIAWRSNGYTPARISTYAVETWLSKQTNLTELVSYSYQDRGHLFWVLYVPNSDCSWVYDVGESLWHKRAAWINGNFEPHWSWNHCYVFGKHLVGDWQTGNIYEMSMDAVTDNGTNVRRLRRSPTVSNEMAWIYHSDLTVDFDMGLGPQPPLVDGDGNPRQPQAMLRWSDNRGRTWSNEHTVDCGFAGQYNTRAIWRRLGRSRYRVYELTVTDPIAWTIVDAYLRTANA